MSFANRFTLVVLAAGAALWVSGSMAQQRVPAGPPRGDSDLKAAPRDERGEGRRPMPPPGAPGRRPGEGPPPPRGEAGGPSHPGEHGPRRGGPPGPPHPHFSRDHEQRRLEELKEVDPELYELEKSDAELDRQTHELAEKLRRAPGAAREELQEELQGIVSKHFDVRHARRELHLVRLREELDKLTDSMARRKAAREQIISRRVSELMGEEDDLAF